LQNGASAVLAEQQLVAGQAVEAYPLPALAAWSKLVHPRRSSPRPPGLQAASCCKKSRTPAGPLDDEVSLGEQLRRSLLGAHCHPQPFVTLARELG
jgi:hypothetical protein